MEAKSYLPSICPDCSASIRRGRASFEVNSGGPSLSKHADICDYCRLSILSQCAYNNSSPGERWLADPDYNLETDKERHGFQKTYSPILQITQAVGQSIKWPGLECPVQLSSYSGSHECLDRLRSWIDECQASHPTCNETMSPEGDNQPPLRLLDTGSLDMSPYPRLVDYPRANEETINYCALSYCWGSDGTNFITTRETLQQRTEKIGLADLPRGFQDAITITRKVGCRYLWIDAVCIIQHDKEDWEREACKMHSIYRNAYLVIAATSAPSPSNGIFSHRPLPVEFEVTMRHTNVKCQFEGRPIANHAFWNSISMVENPPKPQLHTRAWTLQERLMARRIIHFTQEELVFECLIHSRCECSGISRDRYGHQGGVETPLNFIQKLASVDPRNLNINSVERNSSIRRDTLTRSKDPSDRFSLWPSTIENTWFGIVSQYSSRRITVPDDRLPALAALARQFASPQTGKYLAGLWYAHLPSALFWSVQGPSKRPQLYRAPSWSWASVEGHIVFHHIKPVELPLKVLAAECIPAGSDTYGKVLEGYITVEGILHHVDIPPYRGQHLYALQLRRSGVPWALLLKRSERVEDAWERVGIDHIQPPDDDLLDRSLTTITIV
ncbi:heterokaryon incompatibility protein-domain-containing protein [Aspergillus transmontanensis]|uniref:Heterokaryon incompatibility protein-domain-containing protein n=1 Tax=Aspergillus transmontanensis TaxID=1034304 RepID=A0A5N6W501_9EURO|nr:heterokaryon incompatibility protein-domain-containing protein [Aspergillus transmontanensis]